MNTQTFQAYAGGLIYNILGQTGAGNSFFNNYTADAKWRGTLLMTYAQGRRGLTPSMSFVSRGIMDYLGVTPNDPNYANACRPRPPWALQTPTTSKPTSSSPTRPS